MRILSLTALLLVTTLGSAAPVLAEKPPRWEYAEVTFRSLPGRPKTVDADGNEVAAVPPSMSIKWIAGSGEMTVKSWEELSEKLKLFGFKTEGSAALRKIRMLNALGGEGRELMEQQQSTSSGFSAGDARSDRGGAKGPFDRGERVGFSPTTTGTWLLKRRVP
jgi:hypothetical protein